MQGTDYFRREDRFWTDQDFPETRVVCQRIEAELKPIGLNEPGLKAADETLHTLMRRRKDRKPGQEKESSRSNETSGLANRCG
jgi:hypothetical protein